MRVAGFNFTKVSIEKMKLPDANLKIQTDITISEIKETESKFFKAKESLLEVDFTYTINYNPEIALVELAGKFVLASSSTKETKNVLDAWKNKQMPEDFRLGLFNAILKKVTPRALVLEDELNLPTHIAPPSLKLEKKEEETKK